MTSIQLFNFNTIGGAVKKKEEIAKVNIKVELIKDGDEINGNETNFCNIKFHGTDINYILINTLRRIILTLIPIYSFNVDNIEITKNTSIFDNDYMKLRLSNFPIYLTKSLNKKYMTHKNSTIETTINHIETLTKSKILEYQANLGSAEIDIVDDIETPDDILNNLTIYINVKNDSSDNVMNVMTNTTSTIQSQGVKYYLGKEQISHIYTTPLLIIQLKPKQEFVCTLKSNLNIARSHATYRCCTLCAYEEITPTEFILNLMSRRQLSEKDILIRACKIIKDKIEQSKTIITENILKYKRNYAGHNAQTTDIIQEQDDASILHYREGTIVIEGEQHTLGNLLSHYMRLESEDVEFAAYRVGHPNVNKVEIIYKCSTNILNIIANVSNKLINIFDIIEKQITDLDNFGYKYV